MAEMPWSKFFWSDWESDQGLRLCSLAAQGLWMRMLCVCAKHEQKGYLSINGNPLAVDAIARLAGVAETEAEILMSELERNGVFSRNRAGCIYSRRMVKDEKRSQEGRKHKNRGLKEAADKTEENPAPSRVATRGASPQKPEARIQIEKEEPDGSSKKPRDPPEKHRRAVSLPEGWVPSEKNILDAQSRNFTDEEIRHEAERFRDYHLAKGTTFKDWDAGWRTWLGNARSFGQASRSQANNPGRGGSSIASIVARRRLADRG